MKTKFGLGTLGWPGDRGWKLLNEAFPGEVIFIDSTDALVEHLPKLDLLLFVDTDAVLSLLGIGLEIPLVVYPEDMELVKSFGIDNCIELEFLTLSKRGLSKCFRVMLPRFQDQFKPEN